MPRCHIWLFGCRARSSSKHVVASDESYSQIGLNHPILRNGPVGHISGGHRHKRATQARTRSRGCYGWVSTGQVFPHG
eukprot:2823088-Prymnesium_polylepis.1